MKNIYTCFSLCLVLFLGMHMLSAQGPVCNLSSTEVNFDSIYTDEGPVTRELIITNTGNEPLFITSTHCFISNLQVEIPKGAIPAGKKGIIKITYDPEYAHRLSTYDFYFYTNEIKEYNCDKKPVYRSYTIYLKGRVCDKPGPWFYIPETTINYGYVKAGEDSGIRMISYKNMGETDLVLTGSYIYSPGIQMEFVSNPVPPGGTGYIKIYADLKGKTNLHAELKVFTNEIEKRSSGDGTIEYKVYKLQLEGEIIE